MTRAAAWARRVRGLTAAEWLVLGESAAVALGVEVGLRALPLARVLAAIQGRPVVAASRLDRPSRERLARLARWPLRVVPVPATCLRVALVQVAVLRRRHVPATVRFGVQRRGSGALEFHAWADCDGPLDDLAGAAYGAFEPVAPGMVTRSVRRSSPATPPDVPA